MRLLGNRVLLQQLPQASASHGGILLPGQYQDDRMQWRILAIGQGKKVPSELQVGDCVLTPLYTDHVTLDDGTKIVGVEQLIAFWRE
jgi:co-chaperonin GroES (HSP10)